MHCFSHQPLPMQARWCFDESACESMRCTDACWAHATGEPQFDHVTQEADGTWRFHDTTGGVWWMSHHCAHCAASKGEPFTEFLEEQEEQTPRRCWDGSQCTRRVCDESCSWARSKFTQHASYCEQQFGDGVVEFKPEEPEPRRMTLTFENVDGILTPVVL